MSPASKAPCCEEVQPSGCWTSFVGGHPMAGTAQSGWAAGDAGTCSSARRGCSASTTTSTPIAGRWSMRARAGLRRGGGARADPTSTTPPPRRISHLPHLLAEALAADGGRGAARLRAGRRIVPRRHPRRGHRARSGARDVRSQRRAAAARRSTAPSNCSQDARTRWPLRARWPTWSRTAMPPGCATTASDAPRSSTIVVGADGWRRRAGRRGPRRRRDQIRSASPG